MGRSEMLKVTATIAIAAWAAAGSVAVRCVAGAAPPVQVVLDMDAWAPGFQHTINVPEGTSLVQSVAVYILDPIQQRSVRGIGYFGGIDRGISLGHMPSGANQGSLAAMTPTLGSPINPGNVAYMSFPPGLDPGFIGPEVQYIEGGADEAAVIPAAPTAPIFTVDIMLEGTAVGDVFDLYLLDFITVWMRYFDMGNYGAFSTSELTSLDTGGDAVPDGTQSIYGVDYDTPVPVPPAKFLVDYIDGPPGGGPATIRIVPLGDLDGDGAVGVTDFLLLLAAWGPCPDPPEPCPADLDGDGIVSVIDFLILLAHWG
ncbi:MAG: dockerin type I domain-containing protein [Planctomycetota bacterium]